MENDLLARLKLIGKIKQNDKLNVKKMFIQPDNFLTRLSRSFIFVDDRENTHLFIVTTIEKSFELIKTEATKAALILTDLQQAVEGIRNLKQTYVEDQFFCCKIDVLLEDTEMRIGALKPFC